MVDLTTAYMGLELKNPVVPSASPLSSDLGNVKRMEDAGAAAITLHSLFEEQIEFEAEALGHFLEHGTNSFAEALSYFPEFDEYRREPEDYVKHISNCKEAVEIPVIASLNGVSPGGWTGYAKRFEEAGADAVELNVYLLPTNDTLMSFDVEDLYVKLLKEVKKHVSIPVAMKLSPYFSAMPHVASMLDAEGADALVLFNRFYQPDIDIEELEVIPNLPGPSLQEKPREVVVVYPLHYQDDRDLLMRETRGDRRVESVVYLVPLGIRESVVRFDRVVD